MNNNLIVILGVLILLGGSFLLFSGGQEVVAPGTDTFGEKATEEGTITKPSAGTPKSTAQTQELGTQTQSSQSEISGSAQSQLPLQTGFAIVRYTTTGFKPETILITQGSVVQFTNETNQAMWIAADPREAYHGFSQSKSVGKGGSFTFGFTRAGSWTYNNINNPSDKGTVLVVPQTP
ncbi:MAG TPA: hypothetical protein VJI74_01525 [Candidatus Paceibacterota bacterium]